MIARSQQTGMSAVGCGSYSQVFYIEAQIRHMEYNIGEYYKLQVTNLNDVYGLPEQETNRIKRGTATGVARRAPPWLRFGEKTTGCNWNWSLAKNCW
jgi:hypothetical protein